MQQQHYLYCENLTNIPVSLMISIIQMTNFLSVPKISIQHASLKLSRWVKLIMPLFLWEQSLV